MCYEFAEGYVKDCDHDNDVVCVCFYGCRINLVRIDFEIK